MELICTNSKHDSEMKPTSPEFSHTIQGPTREPTGLSNHYFRNNKETGAEKCPAIVSGIVTGDAPVSYWPIFSQSLVTVPEVFMKVKSAKFSSCFFFFFSVTNANDKQSICTKNSFVLGCLSNASW